MGPAWQHCTQTRTVARLNLQLYIAAVIVLLVALPTITCRSEEFELWVHRPLERESLPLDGGSRVYTLFGLEAAKGYEVKISYPASTPARFTIELVSLDRDNDEPTEGLPRRAGGARQLLDTEKLIFETDTSSHVPGIGGSKAGVVVTAARLGVTAPGRREPATVIFNIEVEEVLMGLPLRAWTVMAVALLGAVLIILALWLCPPLMPPYLCYISPSMFHPTKESHQRSD